jgi:hypothetical protein
LAAPGGRSHPCPVAASLAVKFATVCRSTALSHVYVRRFGTQLCKATAHLVLADGVVHLDPAAAVFEAMLVVPDLESGHALGLDFEGPR